MRTIALALLLALPCLAEEPAQLVRDPLSGNVTHVLTPIAVATRNEAACAAAEAKALSLEASVKSAPVVAPVVVGAIGVALAVVAAVVSHVATKDAAGAAGSK